MELKKIAKAMRQFATRNPRKTDQPFDPSKYRVELGGGLRIVLYVDDQQTWHLAAYRLGTFPGRVEMETVRRDFGVPDVETIRERVPMGAHAKVVAEAVEGLEPDRVRETRERVPRGRPEAEQWHIVRLEWSERLEQPALIEVESPPEPTAEYF